MTCQEELLTGNLVRVKISRQPGTKSHIWGGNKPDEAFKLKDGARVENTPVHEAIREALINTIIHADFTGRTSILAVKRPDMFFFRNPGLMRVTVEQAVLGGASDCRNRNLQRMFRHIGFGDQAGSGIPKIYRNWKEQHWRSPRLAEDAGLEFTLLELRMVSLFPEDSLKLLDELVGGRFRTLPELERVILVAGVAEDSAGASTHLKSWAATATAAA
ncbi:MAG: ATP-binding protein [Elusimicrobiota bacterium]|nr:ATP-binding protein [Elusimicrobiota bacterium]